MRLEFAREALRDLDEIYQHGLTAFGATQADLYAETLAATIDLIHSFPEIAPILPDRSDGLRRRSIGVHGIFFIADADRLQIVRVLHQKMDLARHGLGI